MPRIHTITRNHAQAEIGDHRFTMQAGELLPGVPSPADTPCWQCRQPIRAGQEYYVASVWREASPVSSAALVHSQHVD